MPESTSKRCVPVSSSSPHLPSHLFHFTLLSSFLHIDEHPLTPHPQGIISNILDERVVQPLLVSTSALELATETVALILKIDDIQVSYLTPMGSVERAS